MLKKDQSLNYFQHIKNYMFIVKTWGECFISEVLWSQNFNHHVLLLLIITVAFILKNACVTDT